MKQGYSVSVSKFIDYLNHETPIVVYGTGTDRWFFY